MKITSLKKIIFEINNLKQSGKKIVLVTGCFDLLHWAHRQFLAKAKKEGEILIVGLETDKRVKQLKGPARPVNRWPLRAKNLAAEEAVDFIFPLPQKINQIKTQRQLLDQLRPDILAVSSHTLHLDQKRKLIGRCGGKLAIVFPFNPSVSTSQLLSAHS